jgi:ribose transport system substrate-binding protein
MSRRIRVPLFRHAVAPPIATGRVGVLAVAAVHANPKAVEAAVKALKGEKLPKVIDTGFHWYDKSNLSDPKIAAVLYD